MATKKPASGARGLITPYKGNSRYQRRNADGTFNEGDKVSQSQPDDKSLKSSTVAAKGQGDKGDHKPAAKKPP